jgi:hypothetical protein
MKLNIGKCKELVIDFAKNKHCFPPLTVDEVNIERVKSARILGLTVQDNMKWNEHINNIVKKASKRLYMLRLLKRSKACIDTLITVYTTIIRPVLEYECQVWHYNIQQYLCEDIEKIQKRALRIISSIVGGFRPPFLGGRRGPLIIYASNYYARGPHHYICR